MRQVLKSFRGNRSGNFAILSGLLMIPVVASVGIALDYIRASNAQAALYGAADAAAAGAISQASPTFKNGGVFSSDWTKSKAEQDAISLFEANLADGVTVKVEEISANISQVGRKITSKVNFTARIPTTFMSILGRPAVAIKGVATAMVDMAPFVDFYLVLDNSPSMGLGATEDDIDALEAATPDKCAFACHTTQEDKHNYYKIARDLGIKMRIDLVREAAQNLYDKAAEVSVHDNQYRLTTFTFGARAETRALTQIGSLLTSLLKGKQDTAAVDLMTIPFQGYDDDQQTEFDKIFKKLNKEIGKPGEGTGPTDREKVVFFVSDGVADQAKKACTKKVHKTGKSSAVDPDIGYRCQEPLEPKICESLKKRGIKVAVLYTTYQPVPNNAWYTTWISPFQPEVAKNMEACASPGYFFEVSPSGGIIEAMEALFLKVIGNPRITG